MKTLRSIFWDSTRPVKFLTLFLYPLASIGMYLAHLMKDGDASLMLGFLPWWAWSVVALYISVARFVGLFFWFGIPATRRTTPILGVIFWSMLLASAIEHIDTFAFGTLYGVCALLEGWLLSRAWMEN